MFQFWMSDVEVVKIYVYLEKEMKLTSAGVSDLNSDFSIFQNIFLKFLQLILGGILSEPLARLGANVTGLDATNELIEIAKAHATSDANLKSLKYICSSIEEHAAQNEGKYDALVASEIVEHVSNQGEFLKACVKCLKPKGSIFVTTVNKTLPSYMGGIVIAEYVLRWLPKGTHQWEKFITPPQLQRFLEDCKWFYFCLSQIIHC